MGQVLTGGAGQNPARQAAIKCGLPKEKPAYVVNQVCGSGLRSIASGSRVLITLSVKATMPGSGRRKWKIASSGSSLSQGSSSGACSCQSLFGFNLVFKLVLS